jgi:hypothetical protein
MWKLHMTNGVRHWIETGRFGSIAAAVRRIIEIEDSPTSGIHLEMHVCTIADNDDANDADAFGHLEYAGRRARYVIKRMAQ